MKRLKIASSWIRGEVGGGLTPELVTDFACAFGTYLGGGEVVLGMDTRRSSPMIAAAVLSGLISTGCHVASAGICPTPVVQYLVRQRGARGGIVVTGGQNDSNWNALKFVNADGALLNPIQGEEVLDLYHLGEFQKAEWDTLGKEEPVAGYAERYLADTAGHLDLESIRRARFRVVIDLCNGAAGTIIEDFLERLGCRPILINEEQTGDFAHSPAPNPSNMRQLASLMRHVEADIGFALNSDADHIGIVTEKGEALSEECTFPLIADHVMDGNETVVVTNLSTSMMIERVVQAHAGRLVRTKIGEGHVIFRAVNENAFLAGEGSGGVAYMPVSRAFDGFLSMALVLEAMARSGKTVSELRRKIPAFSMKKGVIAASSDRVYHALEDMRRFFHGREADLTDGVRVTEPGLWVHVRASATESVLRVIAEGEDEKRVEDLFNDTVARVNAVVHGKS